MHRLAPRRRLWRGSSMSRRTLPGVLLAALCAIAWPQPGLAQDPETASSASGACAANCESGTPLDDGPQIVPSSPARLAEGHGDQSTPILAGLALVAFGGLVISVLNSLARESS